MKQFTHFPEQRGLKIPPLISEYLEWAPKSRKELIPQLAGALRSSVNRSTGYTPNMMMLGREIGLPAELMFGP
jgi:hypothetical protein